MLVPHAPGPVAHATPPAPAAIGRLCEKHDGLCPICDSYVRPATLVRVCDECNYGSYEGRCVICGNPGVSDAYYCKECTLLEKDVSGALFAFGDVGSWPSLVVWWQRALCSTDWRVSRAVRPPLQRDGCPKIINLGSAKTDLFYERKKYGFKRR